MTEKETALIPIDERIIDFYGDEITTTLVSIENQSLIYIPLRPICDYLGLTWSGQYGPIQTLVTPGAR